MTFAFTTPIPESRTVFAYGAVTLYGGTFQILRLTVRFLTLRLSCERVRAVRTPEGLTPSEIFSEAWNYSVRERKALSSLPLGVVPSRLSLLGPMRAPYGFEPRPCGQAIMGLSYPSSRPRDHPLAYGGGFTCPPPWNGRQPLLVG
jgi:hypothetical protein